MNEATRQSIGAVFIALGDACGPGVLDKACDTITRAIEAGGVSDPYARAVLTTLVNSSRPIATVADVAADVFGRLEELDADTHPDSLRAIISLLDDLDAAVDGLAA